MPIGKGGYHNIGLYLDTYSQHLWGFKYKTSGSAKTTIGALSRIYQDFTAAETFMSDGGKHFDNKEVCDVCQKCNTLPSPTHSKRIRAVRADPSRIRLIPTKFRPYSDHIPTSFLAIKKKVYKSHSEFIPSHSESFRPTYRLKKKPFLPSQNAKFRPNSE